MSSQYMNSSEKESLNSINIHMMQNLYKSTLKVTRFTKVMAFYSNLNYQKCILLVVLNANQTQLTFSFRQE